MATGDILDINRPRFETNERLDVPDIDLLSKDPLDVLALFGRALIAKPPNTAGALMPNGVGMVFVDPTVTSPSAFTIRVAASPIFIGMDAGGQYVVNNLQQDITVTSSAGSYYIYFYRDEDPSDQQVRRFIPAVTPFTEFSQSINTKWQGRARLLFTGGALVPDTATVDNKQKALCCIGQATFDSLGALTSFTPTDNRLGTVLEGDPGAFIMPPSSGNTGGVNNLAQFCKALLNLIQNIKWSGSPPQHTGGVNVNAVGAAARAKNYEAYKIVGGFRPSGVLEGLEETNRKNLGVITVGDGVRTFGTLDATDFASTEAMFSAILGVTVGDRYYLKQGSVFNLTGNVVATGSLVELISDGNVLINNNGFTFVIDNVSGLKLEGLTFDGTVGSASIISTTSVWVNTTFSKCTFFTNDNQAISNNNPTPASFSNITFEDCRFAITPTFDTLSAGAMFLAKIRQSSFTRCTFTDHGGFSKRHVELSGVGDGIRIDSCVFESRGGATTVSGNITEMISIVSDTDPNFWTDRVVSNTRFNGVTAGLGDTFRPRASGLLLQDCQGFEVVDCSFSRLVLGLRFIITGSTALNGNMKTKFVNNTFSKIEGYEGGGVLIDVTGGVGLLQGIKIDDNVFDKVSFQNAITLRANGATGVVVQEISISRNMIGNTCTDTHPDFGGRPGIPIKIEGISGGNFSLLSSISIDENHIINSSNGAVGIILSTSSAIVNVSISENNMSNIGVNPTVLLKTTESIFGNSVAGTIIVEGGAFEQIAVDNNRFDTIFRGVMSVDTTYVFLSVVRLYQHGGSGSENVSVSGNKAGALGLGATKTGAFDLVGFFAYITGDGVNNFVVRDNVIGTSFSTFGLAAVNSNGTTTANVCIDDNVLVCDNSPYTTKCRASQMISLSGATTWLNVTTRGNSFRGVGVGLWSSHMLLITTATNIIGISIRDNIISCDGGWPDPASLGAGFGVSFSGATFRGHMILDNVASTTASNLEENTRFTGPLNVNVNGGRSFIASGDESPGTDGSYIGLHSNSTPTGGGAARNRGWK